MSSTEVHPDRAAVSDQELTVLLAAYGHLDQSRHELEQRSSTRFNFYLGLVTAAIAIAAGLLPSGWEDSTIVGAVAVLGVLVILFGFSIFARQVAGSAQDRRLAEGLATLTTQLQPAAPAAVAHLRLGQADTVRGYAWITALVNSSVIALATAIAVGWKDFSNQAGVAAGVAFVAILLAHSGYTRMLTGRLR